jgi:hypothetical protein
VKLAVIYKLYHYRLFSTESNSTPGRYWFSVSIHKPHHHQHSRSVTWEKHLHYWASNNPRIHMTYHCREGAHFSHGKHELKLRTKKHLRPATGASATSNLHEECANCQVPRDPALRLRAPMAQPQTLPHRRSQAFCETGLLIGVPLKIGLVFRDGPIRRPVSFFFNLRPVSVNQASDVGSVHLASSWFLDTDRWINKINSLLKSFLQ